MKMSFTKVGVTFNGKPMSVADQGATLGKEGKTKLFTLVGFLIVGQNTGDIFSGEMGPGVHFVQ